VVVEGVIGDLPDELKCRQTVYRTEANNGIRSGLEGINFAEGVELDLSVGADAGPSDDEEVRCNGGEGEQA
jgi:hypothetical protein